jgi:hypothetical protein
VKKSLFSRWLGKKDGWDRDVPAKRRRRLDEMQLLNAVCVGAFMVIWEGVSY